MFNDFWPKIFFKNTTEQLKVHQGFFSTILTKKNLLSHILTKYNIWFYCGNKFLKSKLKFY